MSETDESRRESQGGLFSVVRELYLGRRSGVLEIGEGANEHRLHFVAGELHLPSSHRLAPALREFLALQHRLLQDEEADETAGSTLRKEVLQRQHGLVEAMASALSGVEEQPVRFDDDAKRLPADLVGPFPTAQVVMASAVLGRDEASLLRRLGGSGTEVVASHDEDRLRQAQGLGPDEVFLLTRAEKPVQVGELIRQMAGDRLTVLRKINHLEALGLLEVRRVDRRSRDREESTVLDSTVERFLERIGTRLANHPVALPPEEHRTRIGKLMAQMGSMTHYEVLGVGFHDGVERIHEAYDQLAREVHPDNAGDLGLRGKEGALRVLFERATLAYLTLADPERRAAYNQRAGIEGGRIQTSDERQQEKQAVARNNYERALELVENEDYHFAMELARLAVRADPQPEYFALLGRIQAQNPHWLNQAAESYRHAIQLDPEQVTYRLALGGLMEKLGDETRARVHYRAALQKDSSNIEALQALQRLGPGGGSGRSPGASGGLLARLRGLFR